MIMKNVIKIRPLIFVVQMVFLALCAACATETTTDNEYVLDPAVIEAYNTELNAKIDELFDLRNNSTYGSLKGQYPESSKDILVAPLDKMNMVLMNIEDGTYFEPTLIKLDLLLDEADAAVAQFRATVRLEDAVAFFDTHELLITGTNEDNRGFIDFGVDEAYSNSAKSTIEFWLKMADSRYTSEFVTTLTTFSEENGGTDRRGWFVNHHSGNLRMSYGAGTGLQEPSSSSPSLSAWTHVAMVTDMSDDKTGYKWKMYINGELYSQWPNDDVYQDFGGTYQTGVARMLAFMSVTPDGTIDVNKACNGYIKHLHLWSSIKTQDEIKAIMDESSMVEGSESDLISGWAICEKPEDGITITNLKPGGNDAVVNGAYEWIEL